MFYIESPRPQHTGCDDGGSYYKIFTLQYIHEN